MKKGTVLPLIMIFLFSIAVSAFFYLSNGKKSIESNGNIKISDTSRSEILSFDSAEEIRDSISDFNNPSLRGKSKASLLERIEKLRMLLEVADADFNKGYLLDLEMQEFMKDKNFSRSEKVYALWDLIDYYLKKYDANVVRVDYLLDVLSTLQPIELTDNLIDIITGQRFPVSISNKLLEILTDSYKMMYTDMSKLNPASKSLINQSGDKIKILFNQILNSPYDKELFKQVLLLYPRIASANDYQIIDSALQQHQDILSTQDAVALRIDFAMMDQNIMEANLSPLLNSINAGQYSNEDKVFAISRLSSFISGSSRVGEQYTDVNRAVLVDFFKKNEPSIDTISFQKDSFGAISDYGNWFDAYSILNSTNLENKQLFVDEFINNATVLQKIAIINRISVDKADSPILFQGLQKNESLRASLTNELSNPVLSEIEKSAVLDALQSLLK